MGRRPCCAKEGLNRGAWSASEDNILANYINTHGEGKWRDLPQKAGLKRCGKSCRLRWLNYLRPDIKRGNISVDEDELIVRLHKLLGNRWSLIAGRLPGRTDNEIKNYWNINLRKRVQDDKQPVDKYSIDKHNSSDDQMCTNSKKVIRTKAFRCSKVVFPSVEDDHKKLSLVPNTVLGYESPISYSSAQQDDQDVNNSPDFFMDFDIDDLLISDVLKSLEFQEPNLEINFEKIYNKGVVDGDDNYDHQNEAKLYNFTINEETRSGHENFLNSSDNFDRLQENEGMNQLNEFSIFLNSEDDQWISLNNN